MDSFDTKKREGQQIICKDMEPPKIKRVKTKHSEYVQMFLKSIEQLSDEKRSIIRRLGFGFVLEFSCCSNVNAIFDWLMNFLNTQSATVTLENGFSFSLSTNVIHKLLEIPKGCNIVRMKSTTEYSDYIRTRLGVEAPSVEYLCSILNNQLDEEEFSVIFMLAVLSAFIAPNGRGVSSPCYYGSIINSKTITSFDWCSFVLNWLLINIKKYRRESLQGVHNEIGGCKLILVVPYFEFLITSEFSLGSSLPRLPLWTTHIVNSYIALDSLHGSKRSFGRLARKHISSTPFQGITNEFKIQLPSEVQQYIDNKFKDIIFSEEKTKLEAMSQNFFQNLIENSIPTIKIYIDDVLNSNNSSQRVDPTSDMVIDNENKTVAESFLPSTRTDLLLYKEEVMRSNYCEHQMKELFDSLTSSGKLKDFNEQFDMERIILELVQCFQNSCELADYNFQLPASTIDFEKTLCPELANDNAITELNCNPVPEIKEYVIKGINDERKDSCLTSSIMQYNTKFCWNSMNFSSEQQVPGNNSELQFSMSFATKQKTPFMVSKGQTPTQIVPPSGLPKIPNSKESSQFHTSRSDRSMGRSSWGLSLNERLLGIKNSTPSNESKKTGFVSFELLEEDNDSKLEQDKDNNLEESAFQARQKLQSIDPLLNVALDNFGKEIFMNEEMGFKARKLHEEFMSCSSLPTVEDVQTEQVIFANAFEHAFYSTLTTNIQDYSPRIFEVKKVWVDQRTFQLSFSQGGWIHPHVMDCFGMLTTTDQNQNMREGKSKRTDILKHIVIKDVTKILMDPMLNCSDPQYKNLFSLNNVGFRLENAGLVHIPIPHEKQWFLIVANFIDKSFDVLNPDLSTNKFSSIINTVIYNFKNLFVTSYPGCRHLNIHDFQLKHVQVPKFNFRYDSGIFVIQFIRWYNGIEVRSFSNIDVQAIRERVSSQMVLSKFNEHQVPLVKQFLANHAPTMLR